MKQVKVGDNIFTHTIHPDDVDAAVKQLRQFNHHDSATLMMKMGNELARSSDYDELVKENAKLKQATAEWKEAWHIQREATGKAYWTVPTFVHMDEVKIDHRNYLYFQEVGRIIAVMCKIIKLGLDHKPVRPEKKKHVQPPGIKPISSLKEIIVANKEFLLNHSVQKVFSTSYIVSAKTLVRIIASLPQTNARDNTIKHMWNLEPPSFKDVLDYCPGFR